VGGSVTLTWTWTQHFQACRLVHFIKLFMTLNDES
jgi:hypothetical protein